MKSIAIRNYILTMPLRIKSFIGGTTFGILLMCKVNLLILPLLTLFWTFFTANSKLEQRIGKEIEFAIPLVFILKVGMGMSWEPILVTLYLILATENFSMEAVLSIQANLSFNVKNKEVESNLMTQLLPLQNREEALSDLIEYQYYLQQRDLSKVKIRYYVLVQVISILFAAYWEKMLMLFSDKENREVER